jgi:hypothetical protein
MEAASLISPSLSRPYRRAGRAPQSIAAATALPAALRLTRGIRAGEAGDVRHSIVSRVNRQGSKKAVSDAAQALETLRIIGDHLGGPSRGTAGQRGEAV